MSKGTWEAAEAAARLRRRLRRQVEVGPSLCALAVGGVAFGLGLFRALGEEFADVGTWCVYTCALMWVVGLLIFAIRHGRTRGAWRMFARYEILGSLAALGNCIIVLVLSAAGAFCLFGNWPLCVLIPLVPVAVLIGIIKLRPMRWFTDRASEQLEPLVDGLVEGQGQRPVASGDGLETRGAPQGGRSSARRAGSQ